VPLLDRTAGWNLPGKATAHGPTHSMDFLLKSREMPNSARCNPSSALNIERYHHRSVLASKLTSSPTLSPRGLTFPWTALLDFNPSSTLDFVLGQRFDYYECGRLSWLGQLYGAL